MFAKWLPWRYVVRRVARARGFVDPISVLSRLHAFAEPSEVTAPVELLRAGVVFHARGLMNAGSIQHNRDWIWPFWVERQFDPNDDAFLPRAFSVTHVNLTHRNWTAVGIPGCDHLPIVDPRGLLTPYWDGWSIDGWIFQKDGGKLIPSRERVVQQELDHSDGLNVSTLCTHGGMEMLSRVEVVKDDRGENTISQSWVAKSDEPGWLLLSLRPYNPEGVSFVHNIALDEDSRGWKVGDHGRVRFSTACDQHFTSDYKHGDVSAFVWNEGAKSVECKVGMATAAALFELKPGVKREVSLNVPLDRNKHRHWMGHRTDGKLYGTRLTVTGTSHHKHATEAWASQLDGTTKLGVPDERFRFLHDAAMRSVVLHCPGEVYPGPYTYKRFWVRDTAFILNAALCTGLHERATEAMPHLLQRQDRKGYFHSQDGEWDANGQAMWLMERYLQVTNQITPDNWESVTKNASSWIRRKLLRSNTSHAASGLLPAGFSAEHLGPNDFYYWDDFWSIAGLQAAGRMLRSKGNTLEATKAEATAKEISKAIELSLQKTDYMRSTCAYPAAPERRMDAGAIGSVAATYPLQLVKPDDERMQGTIEFLLGNCMVGGGFFQDMIHSGINPYLTLHVAQALLRNGDGRYFELINTVAKLATSTGQWPEAIHPKTHGGCMGDGQHIWAAAEWLMAVRNMFVREEGDSLILGSGIPPHWHYSDERLQYGPTWTPWGKLELAIQFRTENAEVQWNAEWHRDAPPHVKVAIPCFHEVDIDMTEPTGKVVIESNHTCSREVAL